VTDFNGKKMHDTTVHTSKLKIILLNIILLHNDIETIKVILNLKSSMSMVLRSNTSEGEKEMAEKSDIDYAVDSGGFKSRNRIYGTR
jgi:hypothetical protein